MLNISRYVVLTLSYILYAINDASSTGFFCFIILNSSISEDLEYPSFKKFRTFSIFPYFTKKVKVR